MFKGVKSTKMIVGIVIVLIVLAIAYYYYQQTQVGAQVLWGD